MTKIIIWIIANLLSTFSIAFMYYKFTGTKKVKIKAIILFLVGFVLVTALEYFNLKLIASLLFFIFYPLLFYFINPLPIKKVLYYVIIIWIIGIGLDLLSMVFISLINNYINLQLYNHETVVTIFIIFVFLLLSHSKKLKKFIANFYDKLFKIKYANLALIVFIIFIFLMALVIFFNLKNLSTDLLLTLLILLVVMVFILLIKHKINAEENIQYLRTLKENNDFYIKVEEDNRIFKHNLLAKLLSIKSVSNKKAILLIDDLIEQFVKSQKLDNSIKVIPYGLNGIIYQKVYPHLKELDINIINNVNYDIFDVLNARKYNVFVEKIIIALDNALEASSTSTEKILSVSLYDSENEIVFEIRNTFSNYINIDELGANKFSSKGLKRGLGLLSALRNNEAYMAVEVINNSFVTKISVKKKK